MIILKALLFIICCLSIDDIMESTSNVSESQRSVAASLKSVRQQPINYHIDLRMSITYYYDELPH